jgi:hypothetical protein
MKEVRQHKKIFIHQHTLKRIYKKLLDKTSGSCRVLCGTIEKPTKEAKYFLIALAQTRKMLA